MDIICKHCGSHRLKIEVEDYDTISDGAYEEKFTVSCADCLQKVGNIYGTSDLLVM